MIAVTNSKHLFPYIGKLCVYCHCVMTYAGKRRPTRDHVMPRCKGHNYINNKVICCFKCNNAKAHLHIISWWSKLKAGNDSRAPIVFAFIVEWIEKGLLKIKTGVKKNPLELYREELKTWTKPIIIPDAAIVNVVSRIGSDEITTSLMATWH